MLTFSHTPPPGTSTLWLPPMSRLLLLITCIWKRNPNSHHAYLKFILLLFQFYVIERHNCNNNQTFTIHISIFHICKRYIACHTSLSVIFSLNIPPVPCSENLQRCWYKYKFHYSAVRACGAAALWCTEYVSSCRVTKCRNWHNIILEY